MRYRTVLAGTCLLNGRHTRPGFELGCPVLDAASREIAGRPFSASLIAAQSLTSEADGPGQPGQRAFIYLVRSSHEYKIGCSREPDRRAKKLRGELLDAVAITFGFDFVEARVHQAFSAKRLRSEWFALDDRDIAGFEAIVREAVQYVKVKYPLASRRRVPGRPALDPQVRRQHERDRKRRQRARNLRTSASRADSFCPPAVKPSEEIRGDSP